MNRRLLPVGAFVCLLRESLEVDPIYSDIWLEGEVRDISRSSAGHTYFTLGDEDGCLKCVLFRGQSLRQHQPLRFGDNVAIHGGLSIYPRTGSLQVIVDLIRPAGLGASWLERELLRQRLEDEGLFAEERKRPLPAWPLAIGIVTSAHGAAWQDIQAVMSRRFPLTKLILSAARVQGDGAPESIVAALAALRDDPAIDVIIVARGGGAQDDLEAFNDERVVRAIFASRAPVISGVGHATDRTLTDDVADVYAPTPSAAAEICVPSSLQLVERVRILDSRLYSALSTQMADAVAVTEQRARRLLQFNPELRVQASRGQLTQLNNQLRSVQREALDSRRQMKARAEGVLQVLDPDSVLKRGYAVLRRRSDNAPIFSQRQIEVGATLVATVQDGSFSAVVARKPVPPIQTTVVMS